MAASATVSHPSLHVFRASKDLSNPIFLRIRIPSLVMPLRAAHPRRSVVVFARRKKPPPSNHQSTTQNDDGEEDDADEDAFEALFAQLEKDLKNGNLSDDDADDEISEEDLAKLEQELEDALDLDGDACNEDSGVSSLNSEYESGGEDSEEKPSKLKNWQLRRLAHALKVGRRKTSIKNLAAELGLERALVLEMLRDPPPHLLLMSASLPDEATQKPPEPESKPVEPLTITNVDIAESKPESVIPVHVMRSRWIMQKRLKKLQVQTLERVYSRTKRPTNTMISSIVHVTNLPWKKVVQWFEDKRQEEGVPQQHAPYRPSMSKSTSKS